MSDETQVGKSAQNICPSCGFKNRLGDLVCRNCGRMLAQGIDPQTRKLRTDEMEAVDTDPSKAASKVPNLPEAQFHFPEGAAISLRLKEVKDPLIYEIQDTLLMGRYDKSTDTSPDIDMHRFAGYLLGVSRQHAKLHREGDNLFLEDLGSSNGTFLNGRRLGSHEKRMVPNESRIGLGDLHFTIAFI